MKWGGEDSSRLKLLAGRVQAPIEMNHPLTNFGRRLESEVRARARGLEVLANGAAALAKEECECWPWSARDS